MKLRTRGAIATAVALSFIAAACGSDSKSSDATTAATQAVANTAAPAETAAGTVAPADTQAPSETDKDADLPDISPLLAVLKKALGEDVSDVRTTNRLTDSAVILAAGERGPDLQMQRLLRRAGRAMLPTAPVLELNPRHKLIEALVAKQDDESLMADAAGTLLDLARIQEGDLPRDPAQFARRVTLLLGSSFE